MTDQTNQTNQPLTEQQLGEIEARTAAAEDGWHVVDTDAYRHEIHGDGPTHVAVFGGDPDDAFASYPVEANAQFAAHARADVPALLAEVRRLRAELATALRPNTPRLCVCGHSNHAHTVPAPHSCFAFGQTCPCRSYQQLPHDEAMAQLARNREAAARRTAAGEQPAAEGAQR